MSKRKFLNEINKMTRKGEYPSLRILLEEDEENKDDSSDNKDDAMGGDNPFGDDNSDEEGESGAESGDTESSDGGGEELPGDDSVPDDAGEISDTESKSIKVDTQVNDIAKNIEILNNKPDIDLFIDEFLPNSSIVDNKIYNLKNFLILKEDIEKLEKSLEVMDDILNKDENKEKILQIKKKANALQTGDANFKSKIPGLVQQTLSNIEHFDSLYDKSSIAASDMFDSIEKQSVPKDLKGNIEEYMYQLAKALDDQKIPHALNVKASIDASKFKNAKGGFNRS